VLTISVSLILTAVPLAVLSLIRSVSINVQTVLTVIIISFFVLNCYDDYTTLIHLIIYFGKILSEIGLSHAHHHISKRKVNCYQEAGVIISYCIIIYYSSFFPVSFLVDGFSIVQNLLHPCRGHVEAATGIYDGI